MSKKNDQLIRDEAVDEIRQIPNYPIIVRANFESFRNPKHKPMIIKHSYCRYGN